MQNHTDKHGPDETVMDDDFWASILKETMAEADSRMGESAPPEDDWDAILDEALAEAETRMGESGQTAPEEGATDSEENATASEENATASEESATASEESATDPEQKAAAPEESAVPQPPPSPAVSAAARLSAIRRGETLLGTYRVESDMIGKGGMGAVWKVRHSDWYTELAMKRPKPSAFQTEKQKENFIRECECWINLGLHPNIVTCYYVREIGGVPTIFSEWMDNGDLETHINKGTLYEGTDAEVRERLLDIAIQFARGLRWAHENNLVHRDVKPDNLLLTKNWEAKVSDFGISQARAALSSPGAGQSDGDPNATQAAPGGRAKTPSYCSPEQAEDRPLTRRTDIYSWAVSVLEMYLGYKPWAHGGQITGPVAGLLCRDYFEMCEERPIPEALRELLAKCLEQEPDDRPHDFGEVEAELLAIFRAETGKDYARPGMETAANTADGLNNQAVSYMEIGMEDSALRCLERADRIDASHPEAMYNRALIDWRKGVRTGMECFRQLESHPYFRTEDGRHALEALPLEAGKERMDAPLMEGIIGYTAFVCSGGDYRSCAYLRGGKAYIITPVPVEGSERDTTITLTVLDARTGEMLTRDDFAQFRDLEGRGVREAVLNHDGTRVMLAMTDDTLILYDLASRSAVREYSLHKTGMYDTGISLRIIGDDCRFVRRLVSHGLGHAPPTDELYDLRTGTRIEQARAYSDWELIRLGADGELPPPRGKAYRCSLSDGRRTVPIYTDDKGSRYCDEDGKPGAPVPAALASCLDTVNSGIINGTRVLRITADGRVWLQGDEGLMEFELSSGKCLRSFPYDRDGDRFVGNVSVDEDGFGILVVRWGNRSTKKDSGEKLRWYYRRFEPVRPEDRAPWLYARLENYGCYREREREIEEHVKAFTIAERFRNTAAMCNHYGKALELHGFYGTETQRDMAKRLNRTCRQTGGALFLYTKGMVKAEGEEREKTLAPFGLDKEMPKELVRRIHNEKWVPPGDSVTASPDGRRALILSRSDVPTPAAPGIYLMDIPTNKLWLLKEYNGKSCNTAGFCSDGAHIVYGDTRRGVLRLAELCTGTAADVGQWQPARDVAEKMGNKMEVSNTMLGTMTLPGERGEIAAILWPHGFYTFKTEEDRRAFYTSAGSNIRILDACESHGLLAYTAEKGSLKDVLRVWSVDERRVLMETPLDSWNRVIARFGRTERGALRLLVAPHGLEHVVWKEFSYQIYQFRCSYDIDETRRRPPTPRCEWSTNKLPECKWRGAMSEETRLENKAVALAKQNTAESLTEAYGLFCELIRSFPASAAKERHLKNRGVIVNNLKYKMQEMEKAGDAEGLDKLAVFFANRAEQYPDEEKTPELLSFSEDLLAYVLSNREDIDSKRRALELYNRLYERADDPKQYTLYAKNISIVKRQLRQLEKASKPGGGPFSFGRKK